MIKMLLVLILFLNAFLSLANLETSVQVSTKSGPVKGQKVTDQDGNVVNRFLGIPYAQPPIGKLRFRKPQSVRPWTKPLEASQWPNNCIQTYLPGEEASLLNKNFSEDCLYLNIWSPEVNKDSLRLVLFWIYGGGLTQGTSTLVPYDSATLAAMVDAVVVTINYRISSLGFFYSDQVADISGNQGFWDQALALKWVSANIAIFGGDPKQITIFGQSAGSWSVSAHILSPISRDLFQRAIMMSGSITHGVVDEPSNIVDLQLKGIRAVGCASEQDTNIGLKVIECLEKLPPKAIDSIYYKSAPMFHPVAVVDGHFFPSSPLKMLSEGNHKKNFSLLVSTVFDEGASLEVILTGEPRFRAVNPDPITLDQAIDFLYNQTVRDLAKNRRPSKSEIKRIYFNGDNAVQDKQDLFRQQVGITYGDLFLSCPTLDFAKSLFASNSVDVYQWFYRVTLGPDQMFCPTWAGTCHGDEMVPVFAIPFRMRQFYPNRLRDITREVIQFFKDFSRTGTPGRDQSEWQAYFKNDDQIVAPYYDLGNEPKSQTSFKFDLRNVQCQLWNRFYA